MLNHLRKISVVGVLLLAGLGLAGTASALPIDIGDVLASTGNGQVNVYGQDGTFKQTLDTTLGGYTTGGTFDSAGNFYVTNFSSNVVSQFDSNGTLLNSSWATGIGLNESIVFDASGNAYIGNAGAASIKKVDSTGAAITSFPTLQNTDWIDLKADQVTLLYSNEGNTIRELNTATNIDTVFTSGAYGSLFAKRYLPDNGVIAASGDGNVYRWDASGVLQQTYAIGIGSVFALNIDPNGTSFWTGATGGQEVRKINIATGAVEQSWSTGVGQLYGLTVAGEIQAGGGGIGDGGGGDAVPEPGTGSLLLLGLAGLGMARRRKA
jgi:hypothetical protein